jgi:drug/metabolite transporter (DMT)-like permease
MQHAPATPQNPGLSSWLLVGLLSVIWGTAFMGMAVALEGHGPLTVAAGRTAVGALALLAVSRATGQGLARVPGAAGWRYVAALALTNVALPFALLAWGLQHVPSAFAGVTMGAVPLFILPLAYLFSPEEGIGPRRVAGVALGFAGLAVLVGPGAFAAGEGEMTGWGRLACVGATLCYAVGSILTRRAPAMPSLTMAAAMLALASALLVPLALWHEGVPDLAPDRAMLALLYIGLLPTGLAFFVRVRIITTAGSLFMSIVSYLVPVWAVIFGVALMGEALPPQLYAALSLILAGIALSQWRTLASLVGMLRR